VADGVNVRVVIDALGALTKTSGLLLRGLERAGIIAEAETIRLINTGQPVGRTSSGRLKGLNPSTPPDPPHVLTGQLKQSTTHEVGVDTKGPYMRFGSRTVYAARLEFGFVGTDALGRNISQEARPYVRRVLAEQGGKIGRAIRG